MLNKFVKISFFMNDCKQQFKLIENRVLKFWTHISLISFEVKFKDKKEEKALMSLGYISSIMPYCPIPPRPRQ